MGKTLSDLLLTLKHLSSNPTGLLVTDVNLLLTFSFVLLLQLKIPDRLCPFGTI